MDFFQDIFLLLFGNKSPEEKERRMALKFLEHDIKRNRFKKFYKCGTKEALPALGEFFLNIYKSVCKMQIWLKNADENPRLQEITIDFFINKQMKQLLETISIESLDALIKTSYAVDVLKTVEHNINSIHSLFNSSWCFKVDECYKTIQSFLWLVNFDYYGLLRKMDSKITEYDVNYKSAFFKVKADYIIENIKDFLSISAVFEKNKEMNTALEILKRFNNNISISQVECATIFQYAKNVLSSSILYMIVRHSEYNPYWKNKIIVPHKKIADKYIKNITQEALSYVKSAAKKTSDIQSNDIYKKIFFNVTEINPVSYYIPTDENGFDTSGFTFTKPYKYTMIFLSVFFYVIKDICNIFVVYGEWNVRDIPNELSTLTHEFTECNTLLLDFDRSLSNVGSHGENLASLRNKSFAGKKHSEKLDHYLEKINAEVMHLIEKNIECLKSIGTYLVKFINIMSNESLNSELKNIKRVLKILKDKDYNLNLQNEKIELFIRLLKIEGF